MKVKHHAQGSIIFPDFEVCIILEGVTQAKRHSFGQRIPFLLSNPSEGDILGFVEGDGGLTSHVETWVSTLTDVEAIWMTRQDFHHLWAL